MANQRTKQAKAPKEGRAAPAGWALWARIVVTIVVVWHLTVVFLSPLSIAPTSPLVHGIAQSPYLRWYSDPLYLNHGYHFFGPDPPLGGQLVRYQVFGDDGQVKAEGEFPNLDQQWPRLWYHRHMMLADQMSGVGVYGDPNRDKQLMLTAYARYLLRKHDGAQARLENVYHRSLRPEEVLDEVDSTDPRLYEVLMTVDQRVSDLDTPLVPPAQPAEGFVEEIPIGVGR